jgi:hypothetical protein
MKYDCFGLVPHPETIFEGMFPEAPKLRDYELEFITKEERKRNPPFATT